MSTPSQVLEELVHLRRETRRMHNMVAGSRQREALEYELHGKEDKLWAVAEGMFPKGRRRVKPAPPPAPPAPPPKPKKPKAYTFTVEEQRTSPTVYGGSSWGKRGKLLVQGPNSICFYVAGHTTYLNRMSGSGYYPSHIYLARDSDTLSRRVALRLACGRLSRKTLELVEVRKAVAEEWGEAVAAALDVNKTIVVTEKTGKTGAKKR